MRPTTIVIVGPHGVGKSTTGQLLAESLSLPFHDELGRRLARDLSLRPSTITAADSQPAFDEAVMAAELHRDAQHRHQSRVVETWHPGNLAYAQLRSSAASSKLLGAVRRACFEANTVIVPLVAGQRTLNERKTEPGAPSFFMAVAHETLEWAARLQLSVLHPVSTDGFSTAQVVGDILSQLSLFQEVA